MSWLLVGRLKERRHEDGLERSTSIWKGEERSWPICKQCEIGDLEGLGLAYYFCTQFPFLTEAFLIQTAR